MKNKRITLTRKSWITMFTVLLALSFLSGTLMGNDLSELIKVYRNTVTVEVDSIPVSTDNFVVDGTTYIPLRAVTELFGKEVGWNALTKVASINEPIYQVDVLSELLPSSVGYEWKYEGFAEYGHKAQLNSILSEPTKRMYMVSGRVDDMSDGESTKDFSIELTYTINGNSLIQTKTEEVMMDSKYDQLTLIQTPLVVGTYWTENVRDQGGVLQTISGQIMKAEVKDTGLKEYTVLHKQQGSDYYEQRVIRENIGVVSFEKLFELGDEPFTAGYFLSSAMNMTQNDVTLYFPNLDAQKVWKEVRTLTVYDNEIAKASILGLIEGTNSSTLSPSIPDGTRLLSINLENGLCTVDFSRAFVENHPGGSAGELMTLGSIVNTLTEFPEIERVQILVEGQVIETIGNISLEEPLYRFEDLIGN
ncbi:conserved protein of unknown function [Petrocella atlantisensis]|uniref:GerMN domain-containing protein n=1 Tax=Petrocella atlantisensis TaxID=2173034 RepID=A0A3P7RWJ1_9FIRM|nr:GerMN domain-containing protein [Petrocella atlantisensis]VDN47052.1 conserved protein of unknown function [Petrocella atlantisensis]